MTSAAADARGPQPAVATAPPHHRQPEHGRQRRARTTRPRPSRAGAVRTGCRCRTSTRRIPPGCDSPQYAAPAGQWIRANATTQGQQRGTHEQRGPEASADPAVEHERGSEVGDPEREQRQHADRGRPGTLGGQRAHVVAAGPVARLEREPPRDHQGPEQRPRAPSPRWAARRALGGPCRSWRGGYGGRRLSILDNPGACVAVGSGHGPSARRGRPPPRARQRRPQQRGGRADGATLPWFREMPAESRSWVNLVAQAGVAAFLDWFRDPRPRSERHRGRVRQGPRELVRVITFQQTVDLIRVTIEVVEEHVDELAPRGAEASCATRSCATPRGRVRRGARLRRGPARGAWDARLEALVVDALLRGEIEEGVRSRAAALGWTATGAVLVVVGHARGVRPRGGRRGRAAGCPARQAVGARRRPGRAAGRCARRRRRPGPRRARCSASSAPAPWSSDRRSRTCCRRRPRPTRRSPGCAPPSPGPARRDRPAEDLLPERALAGDPTARAPPGRDGLPAARRRGRRPARHSGDVPRAAPTLEASARALFVHPNTVRYRLRRVADVTGLTPTDPRGAATLRVALTLGRLSDAGALL